MALVADPTREIQRDMNSQGGEMCLIGGLDINTFEVAQSRLSLGSTWDSLEKNHSLRSLDIIQIDGTDNEGAVGLGIGTAVGGGAHIIGTLRRRFSFEDSVDEKGANLLETGK